MWCPGCPGWLFHKSAASAGWAGSWIQSPGGHRWTLAPGSRWRWAGTSADHPPSEQTDADSHTPDRRRDKSSQITEKEYIIWNRTLQSDVSVFCKDGFKSESCKWRIFYPTFQPLVFTFEWVLSWRQSVCICYNVSAWKTTNKFTSSSSLNLWMEASTTTKTLVSSRFQCFEENLPWTEKRTEKTGQRRGQRRGHERREEKTGAAPRL